MNSFVLPSTFRNFASRNWKKLIQDMTAEEIKRIVDDERAEQLTAQLCRHWEVATERLEGLVHELEAGIDTCFEAEIYAAMMRMQSSLMALMELNKIPTAFLFSEYLERIAKALSNGRIRQSVMTLAGRLLSGIPSKQKDSFFEVVTQMLAQHQSRLKSSRRSSSRKYRPCSISFLPLRSF